MAPPIKKTDFAGLAKTAAVAARGRRVIGFDVFDTLLRRRIEPETVKDLVAQELSRQLEKHGIRIEWELARHKRRLLEVELGRAAEARGQDHEFRIREMAARWIEQCKGSADAKLARALVNFEIDLEKNATLPTPGIAKTLETLSAQWRLIFVTDIYLEIEDVWALLRHHGLDRFFAAGYCSSNEMKTKRAGTLFAHAMRCEKLGPEEFLFVGDNPHTDADPAGRLGIPSVLIADRHEFKRRSQLQMLEQFGHKNRYWRGRLIEEVIRMQPRFIREKPSFHYRLGLMLAPAYIAFTLDIIEKARRLGLERLFFLSREGLLFLKIYRRLVKAMGLTDAPEGVYLGVSRLALFLPSMDALNHAELSRVWRQYNNQTITQLLRNLNLPAEEFLPLAQRCGFTDESVAINDLHGDERLNNFIADPEVQRRFTAHRDAARAMFRDYLAQKGLGGCKNIGLIDIGWKGTIQDYFVRALGGNDAALTVHGLYFGLIDLEWEKFPHSLKHGFMADNRVRNYLQSVIFKNGPIFEMSSTAPHGSVVGYRRAGDKVKPVTFFHDVERRNASRFFSEVFKGIEDYFNEYRTVWPLLSRDPADWKPYFHGELRRYILYPTRAEARTMIEYSHVESFGVHRVSTYEFKCSWRQILRGGPILGAPRRLQLALRQQFWPEAVVKRSRIPFLNFIYDALETLSVH